MRTPQEIEKSALIQRYHSKNLLEFQFCYLSWKCLFWSSGPGFSYIVVSCHVSSASSNLELLLSHSVYHVLESLREYRPVDWHSTQFHWMCPYSQTQACIPDKLWFSHYVSLSHSWWLQPWSSSYVWYSHCKAIIFLFNDWEMLQ